MKENQRRCLKCGRSPVDDPAVKLYRFPLPGLRNTLRCELWAKFCFSNEVDDCSTKFHTKLYSEHRMLCDKHFKEPSFIDFSTKKLHRYAVPEDEIDSMQVTSSQDKHLAGHSAHQVTPVGGPQTLLEQVEQAKTKQKEILKYLFESDLSEEGIVLHKFPDPEKDSCRFRTWTFAIGGNILTLDDKYVYKYRRICHAHFKPRYWTWGKMLSKNATPTLHLKGLYHSHTYFVPLLANNLCSFCSPGSYCEDDSCFSHKRWLFRNSAITLNSQHGPDYTRLCRFL